MNFLVSLLFFVLNGHLIGVVESDDLIAINTATSVLTLYKRIANEDAPSLESDRACTDANIRKRICEEITSSGYFQTEGLQPVNMEPEILSTKLRDREIFSRIYTTMTAPQRKDSSVLHKLSGLISSSKHQKPIFEYQNLFTPRKFEMDDFYGGKMRRLEHVFVCLLENEDDGEVYPCYVTKEYNLVGEPYRGGRFILLERQSTFPSPHSYIQLLLAEESAKVFEDKENPKYDVELKYLERRQDLSLAPDDAHDPICNLLPDDSVDNYGDRLCAMVMSSSDFLRAKVQYRESMVLPKCVEITVSFQSEEARRIAGEKVYRERALRCSCRDSNHTYDTDHVYITRAYVPFEVFVLEYDSKIDKMFLKNLTIDVGIVRGGVTV